MHNRLDHSFELTFGNNQKNREKALYRLTRIGVFRDYEVDYGSQKFNIDVKGFSLEDSKEQLLNYVIAQQPGRGEQFKSELNNIKKEKTNHNSNRKFIDFGVNEFCVRNQAFFFFLKITHPIELQ